MRPSVRNANRANLLSLIEVENAATLLMMECDKAQRLVDEAQAVIDQKRATIRVQIEQLAVAKQRIIDALADDAEKEVA